MIGHYLLQELLADPGYSEVKAFVRKPLSLEHPKLKCIITDFDKLETVRGVFQGDVVFCCLGTTTRNTPSREGRRKVDRDIPVELGKMAEAQGIPCFRIVSSVGASALGTNFYLRNKGEMEAALDKTTIRQVVCIRPSFLMGDRTELRAGEGLFTSLFRLFSPLLIGGLSKYRPIHGLTVARALKNFPSETTGRFVLHYKEIQQVLSDPSQISVS
jgi:uncharacterized protein YbjT (DUF2867 family)